MNLTDIKTCQIVFFHLLYNKFIQILEPWIYFTTPLKTFKLADNFQIISYYKATRKAKKNEFLKQVPEI